jgi:hypothetical protein
MLFARPSTRRRAARFAANVRFRESVWERIPSLVHDDPDKVYLFRVGSGDVAAYSRSVKEVLSTVKGARRGEAIEKYAKWHEKNGTGFVERDRRQQQELVERRRREAIEKHKAYLTKNKKHYAGITEGSTKRHRVAHCYSCKENLDSSLHIECNSCTWLICYCGACGCGYEKWL